MLKFIDFYGRLFLLGLSLFITCCIWLCLVPFRWKDPSLAAVAGRILAFLVLPILKVNLKIENKERLYENQPCIYIGNHQSNLDVFTYALSYPTRTVVIGKKELKWLPLFGLLLMGSGNILIHRQDRKHSIKGLNKATQEIIKNKLSVWLFPEGTRNHGSKHMLPFKKGAFHLAVTAQVPIVPIVHQHLKTYYNSIEKRLGHCDITIRVLEPISTKDLIIEDIHWLIEEVRSRMEKELETLS